MRLESSNTMKRVLLVPWSMAPSKAMTSWARLAPAGGRAPVRHDASALDRRHHVQEIGDGGERVAVDEHEVGLFAHVERADQVWLQCRARRALSHDFRDVERREHQTQPAQLVGQRLLRWPGGVGA